MSNDTTTIDTPSTSTGSDTEPRNAPDLGAMTPSVLDRDEGDHLHFLNHLATRKVSASGGGAMTAVEFLAPRGFGPPLHCHDDEDEVMIVLDGQIRFSASGQDRVASTGATVFLPHGVPHTFQVLSETARFTTVSASRAGAPRFDGFVAALGTPTDVAAIPEPEAIDPGEVAQACAAYGMEVLGPPPAPLTD